MRAKFINEFERGLDPKSSLGIGYIAKVQKHFRSLGITDDWYEIIENKFIFQYSLNLRSKPVIWLPYNLIIGNNLYLNYCTIKELPNGLQVGNSLYLLNTPLTQLPDDLQVKHFIWVNLEQKELIAFIEGSKFEKNLRIN
jgi:hypothetical protein